LIPNLLKLRVVLERARPQFCLMAGPTHVAAANGVAAHDEDPNFIFVFVNLVLWVRRIKLLPSVALGFEAKWGRPDRFGRPQTVKIPINHVVVKMVTASANLRSFSYDQAFTGQIPKRLRLGFVPHEATQGDYALNPFNFVHVNLSRLT